MPARTRSLSRFGLLVAALALALPNAGCNLFGRLDNPGTSPDKFDQAVSLANQGDCVDAVAILLTIANPNDDTLAALGWGQLCLGGATAATIATTLYKFSSGGSNFTAVGALARALVPISTDAQQQLTNAANTFGNILETGRRGTLVAVAQMTIAAGILAAQARGGSLVQTSISQSACGGDVNSCGTSANCTAGMSNGDTDNFVAAISKASAALSVTGAADLQALAAAINSGVTGAAAENTARCFIFNQVIPNP